MTPPDQIFVVGISRSGTNLMRRILNSSEDVALCGETHFLKHWVGYKGFKHEFANVADIRTEAGAHKLADYVYNIESNPKRARGFWRQIPQMIESEDFTARVLTAERNEWTMFDILMDLYAETEGKPIKGDKTPAHLHSVPELLDHYPNAKVIHMLRDLRAIFVSSKRWQMTYDYVTWPYRLLRASEFAMELFVSVHTLITWLRAVQLHQHYQRMYPDRYFLCQFENLLTDPESQITQLCDFLEIEYTQKMLEISYQNSTVSIKQHQAGYDTSAIDRCRKYLSPRMNRWLLLWSKKHLVDFGYQI